MIEQAVSHEQIESPPLSDEVLWGQDMPLDTRPKDACPKTYKPCPNWLEGPFMCLAMGRCSQEQ